MRQTSYLPRPVEDIRHVRAWAALSFILPLALYLYYGGHPLWDEEAMYAEVPREMLASGDFLYPTLNFAPFLFKPPLFIWANAASLALFGQSELAARLPNVLFAAGTVSVTFLMGARGGIRAGAFSAGALATAFGLVFHTSSMLADVPLAFFTALAVHFFLGSLDGGKGAAVGMYAALALAVMTKGFVGLVFPCVAFAGVVMLYGATPSSPPSGFAQGWLRRGPGDFGLRAFLSLPGLLAFFAITLPWHVAMELRNPGFIYNYIVNEQVLRFFNERYPPDYDNVASPVFLAITLAWLMPWTVFLFQGVWRAMRGARDAASVAALAWGIGGTAFLLMSSSKMEYYSLPLFPAFALVVGRYWAGIGGGKVGEPGLRHGSGRGRVPPAVGAMAGASVLALASVAGLAYGDGIIASLTSGMWLTRFGPVDTSATASPVFWTLLVGSSATVALLALRRHDAAFGAFFVSAFLMSMTARGALDIAAPYYSSAAEAKVVAGMMRPGDVLVTDGDMEYEYCATFNYYTGARAYILPNEGHPILPVKFEEKDRFVLTGPEMTRLWASDARAFFITSRAPEDIAEVQGLPMTRVFSGTKVVYFNKP